MPIAEAQEADEYSAEHRGHVQDRGNPGRLVETQAERAAEIRKPHTHEARIQRRNSRAAKHAGYSQIRIGFELPDAAGRPGGWNCAEVA